MQDISRQVHVDPPGLSLQAGLDGIGDEGGDTRRVQGLEGALGVRGGRRDLVQLLWRQQSAGGAGLDESEG